MLKKKNKIIKIMKILKKQSFLTYNTLNGIEFKALNAAFK